MSAASVLQSFSPTVMPGPVMPMDVAMRFYISHSPPPLRGFLSSYEDLQRGQKKRHRAVSEKLHYKPLRPCLSSQKAPEDEGCWAKADKKRVVFADMKGMSLTAIHVFSNFDDEFYQRNDDLQFDLSDLETATLDLKITTRPSLALDFKQPSVDYLDFRNRLLRNSVCLENCSLLERSLSGTIKVRNVGFEKSVQIRITYDSWASFTDVECTYMNNVYSCQDTDTFTFALELPVHVQPHNRVEFCICYNTQGQSFWDNNDGHNYSLKHVGVNGEDLPAPAAHPTFQSKPCNQPDVDFDQFGSPRMSSGIFPAGRAGARPTPACLTGKAERPLLLGR
uniref:Protein phosphatase 1 regulatory subunit n=1 Tax=Neogobius melanostomus TaxID=47308 RepID=A0A8C6WHS9_9GOBI